MSAHDFDVNLASFEALVLQPSMQTPVVVDFWAPWCEPCKVLKPLLEKLAAEYNGRFLLAKVNADENPELSQHFGVRSIPTVKVLFQGQLVDEFTGALPETELRAFIEHFLQPAGSPLREEAAALRAEGQLQQALATLIQASRMDPTDEAVRLDTIEVLLDLDRIDDAGQLLGATFEREVDRAEALRKRVDLLGKRTDTAPLEAKLAADANDHATRLALAEALAAAGQFEEALRAALEVVRRDRHYDEGAGRKAMLKIFEALAGDERYDALIRLYRRQLSAMLN
jgi:putative thioredoxin